MPVDNNLHSSLGNCFLKGSPALCLSLQRSWEFSGSTVLRPESIGGKY